MINKVLKENKKEIAEYCYNNLVSEGYDYHEETIDCIMFELIYTAPIFEVYDMSKLNQTVTDDTTMHEFDIIKVVQDKYENLRTSYEGR